MTPAPPEGASALFRQAIRLRLAGPDLAPRAARSAAAERGEATNLIEAAVLIALFLARADNTLRLWLVRRTDTLRAHSGQVALPGGKCEPGDRDASSTALREAEEEIGLAPTRVEMLGSLERTVTRTGYVVAPVVGWIEEGFVPNARACEVARAFSVRLADFEALATEVVGPDGAGGTALPGAPAYFEEGEVVWGATAGILHTLARRIGPRELESRYPLFAKQRQPPAPKAQ